jgi:hypothetical protein
MDSATNPGGPKIIWPTAWPLTSKAIALPAALASPLTSKAVALPG